MKIEEAEKYIKVMLRDKDAPDAAKAMGYVYGKEAIETLLAELEKKDKIIDLMSYVITHEDISQEEYCIWRDMSCEVVGGNKECKDCIKQYFEKKVEGE